MSTYARAGHAYMVCPRLLELDPRHGEHPQAWPGCRRGARCPIEHEHEEFLEDAEGHRAADLYWPAGATVPAAGPELVCECGRALVWADLDDPRDLEALESAEAVNGG